MKGISEFVIVLIILLVAIASILVVWLFYNSMFGSVATTGETSSLGEVLSFCMKIESARNNKIYLRNCGTGTVRNDSTSVYMDEAPIAFTMNPSSIGKGQVAEIALSGLWGMPLGNHKIRISNKAGEVERYVKAVLSNYNNNGEVLYLRFDEGSGNITYDLTNYKNNGTLQNIYPLDAIAGNPSLEGPWSLTDNTDANHIIETPDKWTVEYDYNTSSKMLALQENSIVKDGNSSIHMSITTDNTFEGNIDIDDCDNLFPINESQYLEGGNFQYVVKGDEPTYNDQSFYFYNATGDRMCREWSNDTFNLDVDAGNGWRIKSYIWQPSSINPYPSSACNNSIWDDIPYIPKGAKYACFKQFFSWESQNVDWDAIFDKFLIYQWNSMPTDDQRISRASSGWVDGKFGKALYFDGYNDYVKVDNVPVDNSPGANNTVMFWMYWNGGYNDGWAMPFSWDSGYDIGFNSNDYFGFNTYNGDLWGISSSGLSNRWVYVTAIFYNGDGKVSRLFIDGAEQTLSQKQPLTGSQSVSISANVGTGIYANDYFFDGIIDEVRIWNRALTPSEIQAEMYKG